MRLDKLNSFPVIAVASVVLSTLLGFALGSMRSGVSVVPTAPETIAEPVPAPAEAPPARDEEPEPNGNRTGRVVPPVPSSDDRRRDSVDANKPDETAEPDRKPPRGDAEPRKLAEGRVDPVVEGMQPGEPAASIEVTVSDARGRRMPVSKLSLDVRSGPLGWHAVPVQAQRMPDKRGVFRFHPLYPGEYRVRSLNENYAEVEKIVRITRNDEVQYVSVTLQPLELARVEFRVQLEDGTIPEIIEISLQKGSQQDTTTGGRFGDQNVSAAGNTGVRGMIPATRMRPRLSRSGTVTLSLSSGIKTEITFMHRSEEGTWRASKTVDPRPGPSSEEVTLLRVEDDGSLVFGQKLSESGRLELSLSIDGEPGEFTNVTLRRDPEDFTYRNMTSGDGGTYTFEKMPHGTWYVVAESPEFHAPFVQAVEIGASETQSLDVKTGRLRVVAERGSGSPDPEGEMRYRVRLRPMGSGTIEIAYNGDLTGKDSDHIDFTMPVGEYVVRVDAPENHAGLAVSPVEQPVAMTAGATEQLEYTVSAGAGLRFVAVDADGAPVPHVEFLVSFHPAGEVPEEEKSSVRKGGYDGVCEMEGAPFGPVYVHVWTSGSDWNNPDHVFQIDLPAYGTKDLGAVEVE